MNSLTTVLDELVADAPVEELSWGDVLARSGETRHPKMARRRLSLRPRLVLVGVAILLGVLIATPAFGIGSRLVHAFTACPVSRCGSPPPSPREAQKQTGVAPTSHLRTDYDGVDYSVVTYKDALGRLCVAEQVGSNAEGSGYGCDQVPALFANSSLVALTGPSWMQEPNRPGFDPTMWDRMWLDGVTKPAVARLEVVMTDCSARRVPFDPDSFDGDGVFLYTVPRADLHAGIWPYKLVAYDASGNVLSSQPIVRSVPETPAARTAHTRAPQPLSACR